MASLLKKCARFSSFLTRRRDPAHPTLPLFIAQTAMAERENDSLYSFAFASFDSGAGILDKVTLGLSSAANTRFSFANTSNKQAYVSISNDITASLRDDGAAFCLNTSLSLSLKARVEPGQTYHSGKVTRAFEYQTATYTAPEILASFLAEGGGDMLLCLVSQSAKSFRSFGGTGLHSFETALKAKLTVTYFYREVAGLLATS